MRLVRLAVLVLPSLLATSASAFTSDVLLRSGAVAPDGRGLSFFSAPAASGATRVVFAGSTGAILTKSGSTFSVIVKTGDPLPSPLPGTFNNPLDPALNDAGIVVFRSDVNSTAAESGIFLSNGATTFAIALTGGTAGSPTAGVSRNPDINNVAHVVYETGDTTLFLWNGASMPIVNAGDPSPGGGTFTRFGDRPVLNDSDVVAFEAEVTGGPEGVFTWDSVNGVLPVALEGLPASGFPGGTFKAFAKATPVSINSFGVVAFIADVALPGPDTTAVFAYSPGPSVVKIANKGDTVGTETITAIVDDYVGINDGGTIAFEARLPSGTRLIQAAGGPLVALTGDINAHDFSPRLTNGGFAVWRGPSTSIQRYDGAVTNVLTRTDTTPLGVAANGSVPSINNAGDAAFHVNLAALYQYDHGALSVVLAPGGASPGGGTVEFVGAHPVRGGSLAVRADDFDGSTVIALRRGSNPLAPVVLDTDATPAGGTFELFDDVLDVNGQTIVFASTLDGATANSGVFRVKARTHVFETIVLSGDLAPNGALFVDFTAVAAAGRDVAFAASLDSAATGLFLWHRGTITTIALSGDAAPGTADTFASFTNMASRGRRVAFGAKLSTLGSGGVFAYDRGIVTKVAVTGDAEPGGGTFTNFDAFSVGFIPLAFSGKGPAFITSTSTTAGTLVAAQGSTLLTRASDFDPVAGGGAITSLNVGEPISAAGHAIVFTAALDATTGAAWGLVSNQ